ncbi:MAG: DUF6231 family protein [Granulosicoccus sp.]
MTDGASDIYADPQLQQFLSEVPATALVVISRSFHENIPRKSSEGYLCAQTIDDLLADSGRQTLAALSGPAATTDEDSERCQPESEAGRLPVTAVLELDRNVQAVDLLLGKAIRLFPFRLLVCCQHSEPADVSFFALGFRRLSTTACQSGNNGVRRWYEFRISDYKQAPDWLNARFWANPERFSIDEDPDRYCDEEE